MIPSVPLPRTRIEEGVFHARYALTRDDFYAAAMSCLRRLSFWEFSPAVLLPLAGWGLALSYQAIEDDDYMGAGMVAIACVLGAPLVAYAIYELGARALRLCLGGRRRTTDPIFMNLTVGGVCMGADVQQNIQQSITPWSAILRIEEGPAHFFIFVSKDCFLILPKRCFELDALEALKQALRRWGPVNPPARRVYVGFGM